jgi:hypothetical protein
MRPALIALLAALGGPAVAAAAELGAYPMTEAGFDFSVAVEPSLALNKMATLVVRVQAKDPMQPIAVTGLGFDARMPAHDHGMVVKPKVTETGAGEFRVDGVKLHMAGAWELTFTFKKGNVAHKKTVALEL